MYTINKIIFRISGDKIIYVTSLITEAENCWETRVSVIYNAYGDFVIICDYV